MAKQSWKVQVSEVRRGPTSVGGVPAPGVVVRVKSRDFVVVAKHVDAARAEARRILERRGVALRSLSVGTTPEGEPAVHALLRG